MAGSFFFNLKTYAQTLIHMVRQMMQNHALLKSIAMKTYYPEMNETKPKGQIDASLSYNGRHWYLKTELILKGRGISFVDLQANGRKRYRVTDKALEKIETQYTVVSAILLD